VTPLPATPGERDADTSHDCSHAPGFAAVITNAGMDDRCRAALRDPLGRQPRRVGDIDMARAGSDGCPGYLDAEELARACGAVALARRRRWLRRLAGCGIIRTWQATGDRVSRTRAYLEVIR
jgi:hypothetical protein